LFTQRFLLPLLLFVLLAGGVFAQGEFRTFTDTKGRSLEAKVLRVAGAKCQIERKDGKRFIMDIATFTEDDQDYLFNFAANPPAVGAVPDAPAPPMAMEAGAPAEGDVPLAFTEIDFKQKDTDHFSIHSSARKFEPAEGHAEKAWDLMSAVYKDTLKADFEQMQFAAPNKERNRADFSSADSKFRYRIYFAQNEDEFTKMMDQYAATMDGQRQARFVALTPQLGNFDDIDNRWLVIFKQPGRADASYGNVLVHKLAANLTASQTRRRTVPLWLAAGTGYWMENQLFKRCQVHYLDFQQYYADQEGEVTKSDILDSRSTWSNPVRNLCRKGTRFGVVDVLTAEPGNLSPELSGYVFAFTAFLLSTEDRRQKFQNMILAQRDAPDRMREETVVSAMGYDSVEKMEEDWYKYILSNDFK